MLIGVPLTGLEIVLMVLIPTGFVYMTGGMADTGVEFMTVDCFRTGFRYNIGSVWVTGLVGVTMLCLFAGIEDGGQSGINQTVQVTVLEQSGRAARRGQ